MALNSVTSILGVITLLVTSVLANTEKAIFLAPEPISVDLAKFHVNTLDTLTPDNGTTRTRLAAEFPTAGEPSGTATWLILDKLTPRQRYEVRVCWPATVSSVHLQAPSTLAKS
jgi:hypothetical protein